MAEGSVIVKFLLLLGLWIWCSLLDIYFPILEKLCLLMSIYSNIFFYNIRIFLIWNQINLLLFFWWSFYLSWAHWVTRPGYFACRFIYTWEELESSHLLYPNTQDSLLTQYRLFQLKLCDIWSTLFLSYIQWSWSLPYSCVCENRWGDDSNVLYERQLLSTCTTLLA